MIEFDQEKQLFSLHTQNTTYIMGIASTKHLLHLYYGETLSSPSSQDTFLKQPPLPLGSSTQYEDKDDVNLNHLPLEAPTYGKGDYREPLLHIENHEGYRSMDFLYHDHELIHDFHIKGMPQAPKKETLKITLKEKTFGIQLNLYYSIFKDENIIIRSLSVQNTTQHPLVLDRALSANVDFLTSHYDLLTLDGAWIKERHIQRHPLRYGIHKIDSKKGVSSSDHNPFFALLDKEAGQNFGSVYGFNLIYSGNFEANIEISPHDLLRVNLGINSFDFKWTLKPNEQFFTPEAVLTYANTGLNGMRQNMHTFINQHLSNQQKKRPIKINNWEATYFDFNEKKLLAIAKQAKKFGIECFCLDDGWFGARDDDTSSLGDWHENKKKLPGGLKRLSQKIKKLDLLFGLWVEPEMISPRSTLYQTHPDWAIKHPNIKPSLGRHQLVLDLSNPKVVDYLFDTLSSL